MSYPPCPKCGVPMDFYEKDTSSGRDMRTYHCKPCNEYVDMEFGVATWKAMSEAAEEKPSVFPPPSATSEEIEQDLKFQKTLLDYLRALFQGRPRDAALEACSLDGDLRCDNLNIAYVALVIALEQKAQPDRIIAALRNQRLAPNLAELASGIVAMARQVPGIGEAQLSAMMRDGSFAYRALLSPADRLTVGAVVDAAKEVVRLGR